MRIAPAVAELEAQVQVLREQKAKAEASLAKYRGKYKDLYQDKRG